MSQKTLPFRDMTDDQVRRALADYRIGLTVDEARKVQELIKRPPTVTEAVIWGIQGSEHCSYKSSRRFLKQFPTTGKHVILGPKEDSGIVAVTDGPKGKRWGIVVSHESHNHPSQIVPYEGAATGVGGCVRDVVCMGARVIGSLDCLRLGDLKSDESRTIAAEVMRGIAGYGNALGIPNLGGDTVFDSAYNRNCLVNVVSLGILREDEIIHSYVQAEAGKVGYDIILVGKATDRSGFGGAAFASLAMEKDDAEANSGAVQEPNPFLERHLLASTYSLFDWLAREKKLDKVSFKDLGAGGVVCSSVEQVAPVGMGAMIDLEKVHTAVPGLPPEVIGCAETQERFCWICHPSLTEHILKHYNTVWDLPSVAENAQASVIGKVTEDPHYILSYKGEVVCNALSQDITSGLQYTRPTAQWKNTNAEPSRICDAHSVRLGTKQLTFKDVFLSMLGHPTHGSKSRVYRHYDKNILGNSTIEAGEADASLVMPLIDLQSYEIDDPHPGWEHDLAKPDRFVGVALAAGGNGRYGRISPYLQGVNAVVENSRNVAAVGATPRAISDCLNYGNPEVPEQLWALQEGVRGISDACKSLQFGGEPLPVISGNVSLYNATAEGPIDPTANVCVIGAMQDARKAITPQLKKASSSLYVVGERKDELGGSAYYDTLELLTGAPRNSLLGSNVPNPDCAAAFKEITFISACISDALLLSCHDISEGGLVMALFEMTLPQRKCGGQLGIRIDCASLGNLPIDSLLFSETGGFVVEVDPARAKEFESRAKQNNVYITLLGTVTAESRLTIQHAASTIIECDLSVLMDRWTRALPDALLQNKL